MARLGGSMRGIALGAICISMVLAGCLGEQGSSGASGTSRGTLPLSFSYACPPGETHVENGVCVGHISSEEYAFYEVDLAIHPADPDVIAIGVNAYPRTDRVEVRPPTVSYGEVWMYVLFSEDGGATWTGSRMPYNSLPDGSPSPLRSGVAWDPSLAFDASGTLHLTAMVSAEGMEPMEGGSGIIYANTPDLGRTWSPAETLASDANNEFNQITVDEDGRIFASWESDTECLPCMGEVAWSLDGGRTWMGQDVSQTATDCGKMSRVAVWNDLPLVACSITLRDGDEWGLDAIRVFSLDLESGELVLRGDTTGLRCGFPRLVAAANGSLVVGGGGYCAGEDGHVHISRSDDGGMTWKPAVDVAALTGDPIYWQERVVADPWGLVHVLGAPDSNSRGNGDRFHVVMDASDMAVVFRSQYAERHDPPDSLPDPLGTDDPADHYMGLAFTPTHGVAAWARDGGIDVTRVVPQWSSPTNT